MSGVELPAVMVAASPLPKTGFERGRASPGWCRGAGSGRASSPRYGVTRSSRKPRVVRRGQPLVRRERELVLLLAADLPLERGERGVLAHRQPGARLGVARDRRREVRRAGSWPAPSAGPAASWRGWPRAGSGAARSLTASGASEVVSTPPAMPTSICAERRSCWRPAMAACRPVPQACWMSYAGVCGVEPGAEHGLAGEVEVAAVLEHRAGDHLAEPLARPGRTARPARRARR